MNYLKEGYSKPGMENEMTATEANRAVSPRQKTQAVSPRRWAANAQGDSILESHLILSESVKDVA